MATQKIQGQEKITALYCRLSVDDNKDEVRKKRKKDELESNSITNQKQILMDYAKKNGYLHPQFFIDDVLILVFSIMSMTLGGGGFAGGLNSDNKVKSAAEDYRERYAKQAAQEEKELAENNERAEAYAQHLGYGTADEAEDFGINTGKK